MSPVETYCEELSALRSSGAVTKETSGYPALANLFNSVGHCSIPLKAIALAATVAALVWSIPVGAAPPPQGDYPFWSEMPQPARVLADERGTNAFDTAARQRAGLELLKTLAGADGDRTGQIPWPPRVSQRYNAYIAALPDVDGQHNALLAATDRLLQDPAFVQSFLKRYFSAAALSEMEPLLPDLQSHAPGQLASSQNSPTAPPAGSSTASSPPEPPVAPPDKIWWTVAGTSCLATLLLLVPLLPWRWLLRASAPANKKPSENKPPAPPGGPADDEGGLLAANILTRVKSSVRPLAPGELAIRVGAREMLQLQLVVRQSASFSVQISRGKRPLPPGVEKLDSAADLNRVLQEYLESARQQAGARIDAWSEQLIENYRCELSPATCMEPRNPVGTESECDSCRGRGRVTCSNCGGNGKIQCGTCGGSGKVTCPACHGLLSVRCEFCGGSGYQERPEWTLDSGDRLRTANQGAAPIRRIPCNHCGATGKVRCNACSGGRVDCRGCGGQGRIACPRCYATGSVACGNCDATGRVHESGQVKCAVERIEQVAVAGSNPEDQETFLKRVAFDDIGELASDTGGVVHDSGGRDQLDLTHSFNASVEAESAEAEVGGQSLLLRAYGPGRAVFNYHNLIGRLLETDLAGLESCVRPLSLFRSRERSALVRNTNRFLGSEVNARIVEGLAPLTKDTVESSQALASDRFSGAVSEDYFHRARQALGRAMARIYSRIMFPMLPGLAALMTLLFFFGRENSFWSETTGVRIVAVTALAAMLAVGVEQLAKLKLKLAVDSRCFTRLKKPLRKHRNWHRLLMVAIFLFAWYLSLMMVRWILHIRLGTPLDYLPDGGWRFWQ